MAIQEIARLSEQRTLATSEQPEDAAVSGPAARPRGDASGWAAPVSVAALALLVRLAHLQFTAKLLLVDDAAFFEQHARSFLGAWAAAGTAEFWPRLRDVIDGASLQGVLYPIFQSLVYAIAGGAGSTGATGVDHRALVLVQAFLGTVSVWLTYLTARRAFGRVAGAAAGVFTTVYAPLVLSSAYLLAEALLVCLQALILYLLVCALDTADVTRRRLLGVAGGVCTGLFMLRPAFQYAGPLLAFALGAAGALTAGRDRRRLAARQLAAPFAAGVLAIALPWIALNGLVYGSFVWSRTGDAWQQVYWGLYPPNRGWWPPDSPVPPKYGVESLPGARAAGQQIEVKDRDYLEAAIDQVRATPLKALATEVNKLYQAYLRPSNAYAEQTALVGPFATPLHHVLVLVALAGLCLSWRRPAHAIVLATGLFASALPYLASHIDLRYTIPPSQPAAVFAGLAIGQIAAAVTAAGRREAKPSPKSQAQCPKQPVSGTRPWTLDFGLWTESWWHATRARAGLIAALAALPLLPAMAVWAVGVPWLVAVLPGIAPWHAHLWHAAVMCVTLAVAATGCFVLLAPLRRRRAFVLSGLALGSALAGVYGVQAVYDGDWHQWSVLLRPGDAVRQTLVLPAGWQLPPGGRAEIRLYVSGDPRREYEPVVRVNGREAWRLGPGFEYYAGQEKFWTQIAAMARHQGKERIEIPQWLGVPLDADLLSGNRLEIELVIEPRRAGGSEPAMAAAGSRSAGGWVRVWGDYAPRPGERIYEGPAVYSRFPGADEAFLKYVATGEYGIRRWTPLDSVRSDAARRRSDLRGGTAGGVWQTHDLSDAPGRQTGEYRIRLLIFGPSGELVSLY
ncbi:MAG: glycosyltransferase family 39 protein [Chloroflexi bacterium]|nr:glycosyltransferase family 39 protein [Chloroflexota bacterium]